MVMFVMNCCMRIHVYVYVYTYRVHNEMSLLRFYKQKDGLPDLRGTLSTSVTYAARAQANQEVQKAIYQQRK